MCNGAGVCKDNSRIPVACPQGQKKGAAMYEWLAEPRVAWFLFGLFLLLGEVLLPGIVLMFFGLGAWAVVIFLTFAAFGLVFQIGVFIVASLACLLLFRARVATLFYSKSLQLKNFSSSIHDDIVGQEVDVIEPIMPPHPGRVLLNGALWQAKAEEPIAAGSRVRILKQDVLLLTVKIVS